MPILFCAVACDKIITNTFATCDGNFNEIVEEVILKIPINKDKMTYLHGRYLLHYINEGNRFYFCITDRTCQRSRAFLFLNEIRRQSVTNKNDFSKVLAQEMYRYNEEYGTVVIRTGDLEELNSIGVESSETLLGEKLLLVENEQKLQYKTISYVETTPQNITVSMDKWKFNYVVIITIIFVGLSTILLLPSPSYATIVIICLLYAFKR